MCYLRAGLLTFGRKKRFTREDTQHAVCGKTLRVCEGWRNWIVLDARTGCTGCTGCTGYETKESGKTSTIFWRSMNTIKSTT